MVAWADFDADIKAMNDAPTSEALETAYVTAMNNLYNDPAYQAISPETRRKIMSDAQLPVGKLYTSGSGTNQSQSASANANNPATNNPDTAKPDAGATANNESANSQSVAEAQAAYDKAKAKEQSEGNKNLEMFSQATMGIGAMQLAQGIAEKQADAAADADMEAYIQTMRCTYAGKSVKWGPDKIELPNTDLMPYQMEYKYLAQVLKERKAALGLKPGIEAEEILDKASSGLYDDENVGNMGGAYGSRYRAAAGNAKDQSKLAADKKEAKTRMIAGGVIAGAGLVGSMIGDSIVNGKLGELIKESRANRAKGKDHKSVVDMIKKALKNKGCRNVDKLNFDNMDLSSSALKNADWTQLNTGSNCDATKLLDTTNAKSFISSLKKAGMKDLDDVQSQQNQPKAPAAAAEAPAEEAPAAAAEAPAEEAPAAAAEAPAEEAPAAAAEAPAEEAAPAAAAEAPAEEAPAPAAEEAPAPAAEEAPAPAAEEKKVE